MTKENVVDGLAKILRKFGFNLYKNYVLTMGEISHTLDLLAVLTPVTGVNVRLGFVVVDDELNIEKVEKFVTWKQEGNLDKLIVVSLKDVHADAYELAVKFGLGVIVAGRDEALKLPRISGYIVTHCHPNISVDNALSILENSSKGFLFKKKRNIVGCSLVYLPFVVIRGTVHLYNAETETAEANLVKYTFDGVKGFLVVSDNKTVRALRDIGSFADINEDALKLLKILAHEGYKTISDLVMELNLSEQKIKAIATSLTNRSLIDVYADVIELRKDVLKYMFDIKEMLRENNVELHDGEPRGEKNGTIVYPLVSTEKFIDFIESLSGRVNEITLLYYPFYIGVLSENNGKTKKFMLIDGISGEIAEGVAELLPYIEDVLSDSLIS